MHVGDIIAGRFRLESFVGTGGMASVFRAQDLERGGHVALKILRTTLQQDATRLTREARVLAEVTHPGVIRHIAHGVTDEGEPYLAMEWLEGQDLSCRLSETGKLSVAETVTLARRVAEALGAAHKKGVVHRDIKPSNLWLPGGSLEHAKILDFGVARFRSATHAITGTGVAVGTPGYMAPEQARGESNSDARIDVFSLGCVLYECLMGAPTFSGDHVMAVLAKILLQDPPRVRDSRHDVPPGLDALISRMLSKEAKSRPADGDAVFQALLELEQDPLFWGPIKPSIPPAITREEQRLVSVVVAAPQHSLEQEQGTTATFRLSNENYDAQLASLRAVVRTFNARFEMLAEGSVVVMLSGSGLPADQVTRAARCALAMRSALLGAPMVLATGRGVVAGRLPVGEVIDRAFAALVPEATQGIFIDELTANFLDVRFDVETHHGKTLLRGEREVVQSARTLLGQPTACVGRERELALLLATYQACVQEPASCAVLVTAPSGVGKSRVRHEFLHRLWEQGENVEVLLGRGDSLSAGSAFGLLGPAIRRIVGILDGEPLDVQRYKLRSRIARYVPDGKATRVTEFLGELVGVPFPDAYSVQLRAARSNAMLMGDQMRMAWEEWLRAECEHHPVVLVLEDLHWGDLPTVQFVEAALRALPDAPFMVLALGHPEVHERFARLWADCDVTELHLRGLSRKASVGLVQSVLGERINEIEVTQLVDRAHGNAFYLEELIRAVADGKGSVLPESVLGMVQTRLDGLDPEARRVLRAASVFGRIFCKGGVVTLMGGQDTAQTVEAWLRQLVESELLIERPQASFPDEREYAFRHELVRETAYAMLTQADRTLGHQLAGVWLEEMGERDAVVLAEHFERGEQRVQAAAWYRRAANEALEGNDLVAAISRAERGVRCGAVGEILGGFRLVQAEAHRWCDELDLAEACALESLQVLEYGTGEWFRALGELMVLAGLLGRHDRLIEWVYMLCSAIPECSDATAEQVVALSRAAWQLIAAGRYDLAGNLLQEAELLSRELRKHEPLVDARLHRVRAFRALSTGDLAVALEQLSVAKTRFEQAGDIRNECLERVTVGYVYLELGQHERAELALKEALASAARLNLGYIQAYANSNLGLVYVRQGNFDEARAKEETAIAWFSARGGKRLEGGSRIYLADILQRMGLLIEAEHQAERAVHMLEVFLPRRAHAYALLAQVRLLADKPEEALEAATEAKHLLETLGTITEGESRVRLVYAEALHALGQTHQAREALRQAYKSLMARAGRIHEHALRQSFLREVPQNYRTLQLITEWGVLQPAEQPLLELS